MNTEQLFLRTLEDLEESISSNDSYTILRASALLRKLLFDDHPLIDQVNRDNRFKIEFEIVDTEQFFEMFKTIGFPPMEFFGVQDAFDPASIPNPPLKIVKKDAFLKTRIQTSGDKTFTVKDVILHQANVRGGVHPGKPKNEDEKSLSKTEETIEVGGNPPGLRQLKAISRVVLKALQPLRILLICNEEIRANPENSTAYFNRGTVYAMSDRLRKAILDFDKVIELEPDHPKISDVYYNRGHTLMQLAVRDLEKYLEHAPESPEKETVTKIMEQIKSRENAEDIENTNKTD